MSSKKETKKVKKTTGKKNIFDKMMGYFRGVRKEIKRIRWTTGKELVKYSIATITFVLFFTLYFYVVDVAVAVLRSLV